MKDIAELDLSSIRFQVAHKALQADWSWYEGFNM